MTRSILVTGGAGFIGSRLVNALSTASSADRIWVIDNLHPQVHGIAAPSLPHFPSSVRFVLGDVTDADKLGQVVAEARPDLVYHLAAETGTGQSFDQVSRYCDVNVTGTARVIEAIRKEGGDTTRRIILASSRAVYGEGAYRDSAGLEYVGLPRQPEAMRAGDFAVPLPASAQLPAQPALSHSGLPPAPASVYASTKLMQEYLLRQAGEDAPWNATILRFQNVYGPGQSLRNPYTGVLSIFSRQLLAGGTLSIYEDGQIARDFVYVDDVINALVKAGEKSLPHGITLDIGSGSAASILDTAHMLARFLGRDESALTVTGQFRIGDIRHACADIREASKLLDWHPSVSLERGLSMLAEWARKEFQTTCA
jgi:dTDP-L-rhamnose 4-epimerase